MALSGAIATFALLSQEQERLTVVYVSDSQYLIKGMNEWVASWRARGWKRKGGTVENLNLWKKLVQVTEPHETVWRWVRGHAGYPKNEYVNDLAMKAAAEQTFSEGLEKSRFHQWLTRQRKVGHFTDYDPDAELAVIEGELIAKP
jgi:ribonuclease HI